MEIISYICKTNIKDMPYKDKNSPAAIASRKRRYENFVNSRGREKINEYHRNYRNKDRDGKWRVYLLPYCMYVGQTTGVYDRMVKHRQLGNDTTDYIILHICDTEREARDLEKIYHDIGFKGMNPTRR